MSVRSLSEAWPREKIDADTAGLIVLHVTVRRPEIKAIESAVYVRADRVTSVETRYSERCEPIGANVEMMGGQRVYARESAEAVVSLLARMSEARCGK